MKIVNKLGLLISVLTAPAFTVAQPMSADCSHAIHTYVSFNQTYTEIVKKNAVILSQASTKEDVRNWFESPMMKLQAEASRNFSKLKSGATKFNKRIKCTLNYALYQNTASKLAHLAARQDLHQAFLTILSARENRTPAQFSALLLSTKERLPSELRSAKRKIGIMTQALSVHQATSCLDKMVTEGDLKALTDSEAAETYTHYLNNYIQNGGEVSNRVETPLQMSSDASLEKEIATAQLTGDEEYAQNLGELRIITSKAKVYLARKSFSTCPITGSAAVTILVPSNIQIGGLPGQNNLIHEDPALWNSIQAVQYSDTRIEQFPSVVLKNKIGKARMFFVQWAKESTAIHGIAGQ